MCLFTPDQYQRLTANGRADNRDRDHAPVVRLLLPGTRACWLLNELDITEPLAFGLCDLGLGFPELGYVDMHELTSFRTGLGAAVIVDADFEGRYPMSVYADAARMARAITTDDDQLRQAADRNAAASLTPHP